jgi:hypothetical protein
MNSNDAGRRIGDLNSTLEGIYDDYRTISLNKKYNGEQLATALSHNRISEIIIAVGASGSGIAGLTLWKSDYGQYAWGLISFLAILVSILKPILNFGQRIEEYSKLWAEYSTLFARCRNLIQNIQGTRLRIAETGELPERMINDVQNIRSKMVELAPGGDQKPDRRRVEALQNEVNAEIPPATLWVPYSEEETDDRSHRGTQPLAKAPQQTTGGATPSRSPA